MNKQQFKPKINLRKNLIKGSMFRECVNMSWQQIINNRMRSFLTTLGIVIGIASVIALITIVQGITDAMLSQFDSLGTGTLTVSATGSVLKNGLNDEDLDKIANVEYVSGYSPSIQGSTSAVKDGIVIDTVNVKGKSETYFDMNSDTILKGRPLTSLDEGVNSYVCLINEVMEEDAFIGTSPVGNTIIIGGHTYTIIGVMQNDDSISSMMSGMDSNTAEVIVPYKNAMKLLGIGALTRVEVYISDPSKSEEIVTNLEATLDEIFNYKEDAYTVTSMDSLIQTLQTMQTMLTAMLAGIASISLVVGGIGIMNMMLVSVSERTKEIGLRKALGAEPGQIQLQFVVESIMLSVIGGIIGVIIGIGLSMIAGILIGITITPSIFAIVLGVGFSAVVGIGFGWGPSKKASSLHPIDALRSE